MSLRTIAAISIAGYRTRTGDTTTVDADVNTALDEAEDALAEHLRRSVNGSSGLASAERTATLRIHPDGRVYPPAYPVTAAPDLTIETPRTIQGAAPDLGSFVAYFPSSSTTARAAVTWTGGYTASTLPRALANAVYDLANAYALEQTPVPVGATSVRLGDAAVGFPSSAVSGDIDGLVPNLSQRIRRYRNVLGDGLA